MLKNKKYQYTEEINDGEDPVDSFKKENLNKLLEIEREIIGMYNNIRMPKYFGQSVELSNSDIKYKDEYMKFIKDLKNILS